MFEDRTDAGKQWAKALKAHYRGQDVVVLALPRGGAAVAIEVASKLGAPLDLLIVRKVGVPYHQELAMGAVMDGSHPIVVRNDDVIHRQWNFGTRLSKGMHERAPGNRTSPCVVFRAHGPDRYCGPNGDPRR